MITTIIKILSEKKDYYEKYNEEEDDIFYDRIKNNIYNNKKYSLYNHESE